MYRFGLRRTISSRYTFMSGADRNEGLRVVNSNPHRPQKVNMSTYQIQQHFKTSRAALRVQTLCRGPSVVANKDHSHPPVISTHQESQFHIIKR